MTNAKLLKHAQYYSTMGLRVFPLQPGRKTPATPHGCKDATSDSVQVEAWWSGPQPYNVGIATGGGLVVLDVDINHDGGKYGDETLKELEQQYGPLPDTWMCLTGGGGVHYYFRCEDPALTVVAGFLPGLDYRGAGGYVAAPPSIHESGREYVWKMEHTPTVPIAPLPEWLHTLMLNGSKPAPAPKREAPEKVTEGQRNTKLFKLAASLCGKGLTVAEITTAVMEANKGRCNPPLPDSEVKAICNSAGRYERGKQGPPAPTFPTFQPLHTISAQELQRAGLPPIRFLVDGLLPEGGLLTAASKVGKSWLVLDLGLCLAFGQPFLGHKTNQCGVLYLALEDSLNRLQDRMNKILSGKPAPDLFHFSTEVPKLDNGLLNTLADYLCRYPSTRLIIIDTLQKVRGQTLPRESGYAQDYREMETIKGFMDKRGVSVLFVHHNRKMKDDDDPFNMISGTNGIMGAADTIWTITKAKRTDEEAALHITGRDVEQSDTVIRFDKGSWTWKQLGAMDWLAYDRSPIVKTIKKLLEQSSEHRWDGTAKELMEAGKYVARTYLAVNVTKLGHELKALDKPLLDYNGIVHTAGGNGSGGKKHHFYFQDLGPLDDDPEYDPFEGKEG